MFNLSPSKFVTLAWLVTEFFTMKPYETTHFTPRNTSRGMDVDVSRMDVDAWHLANTCLACLAILAQDDLSICSESVLEYLR